MIQTACGSHTHTLIPDREQGVHLRLVVSARLRHHRAPRAPASSGRARPPHKKISIIEVSAQARPVLAFDLRSSRSATTRRSTAASRPATTFRSSWSKDLARRRLRRRRPAVERLGPVEPDDERRGPHTHIRSPSGGDQFEFIHSGIVSWDGKTFAIMDETGGGGTAECDGEASTDGFYYFYDVVKPGAPAPAAQGPVHDPAAADARDLRVAQRERDPGQGPQPDDRGLLPGRQHGGRLHRPVERRARSATPTSRTRRASPTRGRRTGTTAGSTPTAASTAAARPATAASTCSAHGLAGRRAVRGAKRWAYSNPQTQEAWQAAVTRSADSAGLSRAGPRAPPGARGPLAVR